MESAAGAFHDAVIDFLPDATFVIDRDGMVMAWNRAMEEMTGVLSENIVGKRDYEYSLPFYHVRKPMLANLIFMPEVEIEKRYDNVERIGDTLVVDIFIENFRPGGAFFWAKASPLYDPAGNITGAIETIRDITDRKRAEQEIIRKSRETAEIIGFLPDATFVIDQSGKVLAWNHAMEEMTGVLAENIVGKGDYEYSLPFYHIRKPMLANLIFMPEVEIEKRYDNVERIGDTLVVDIFIENFKPGGAFFWAKASPLYDPAGKITGAIETIRDITDRKRAEQEIIRKSRETAEIISFLPDATFVIDQEGKVIAWNHAMEVMTGVLAENILGKSDYEYSLPFYKIRKPMLANLIFMPEVEIEKRYDSVERFGDTLVVDIFIENFRPGGAFFWAKASPLYDPAGKITGAIETIRDITERKRAEQEIVRSHRSLADIISFLPDATFAISREGKVITWNHAMEVLSGVSAESMIGKGEYEYAIPFYGERRPLLADIVLLPEAEIAAKYTHMQREGDTLFVDTFIPPQGERPGRYFWAKASPLYDPSGKITGAIETIRDITERREMEGRLARSHAELQIAAEIQQSFMPEVIPQISGFDIAARSVMAKEVGGDFFDVIPFEIISLDKGTLGILIADVSGKGVPAALFMALSRIVVRVNALWHRDPARAIFASNNIIAQDSKAGMFVTLFYGMLSEKNRTLTYVNAGHNPPMVWRNAGRKIEELLPTGIVLGAVENRDYSARTVGIAPGDIIVLYTDGVTESINAREEMFGEDRLRVIIQENAHLSAAGILAKILAAVGEFAAGMPQFDDITLMVIKGT